MDSFTRRSTFLCCNERPWAYERFLFPIKASAMEQLERPYSDLSRHETMVDLQSIPSRKPSQSFGQAIVPLEVEIQKPSSPDTQTIHSASTLVDGNISLPSMAPARLDVAESLPQNTFQDVAMTESTFLPLAAPGNRVWVAVDPQPLATTSFAMGNGNSAILAGPVSVAFAGGFSTQLTNPAVPTVLLTSAGATMAGFAPAFPENHHLQLRTAVTTDLLPPAAQPSAPDAALHERIVASQQQPLPSLNQIAPNHTQLLQTKLRQQAHQTLAEILNWWHMQRLSCVHALSTFVLNNLKIAYVILNQNDRSRNDLRLFEWDLDPGVQQIMGTIYDRLRQFGEAFAVHPDQVDASEADAAPLLHIIEKCRTEKMSFIKRLVDYTAAGMPQNQIALKESPVGYYLLPLLFDPGKAIPEIACKILLQAGRFGDQIVETVLSGADSDAGERVVQHWLERLRSEMQEEKRRARAVALQRQHHNVGLGLGLEDLMRRDAVTMPEASLLHPPSPRMDRGTAESSPGNSTFLGGLGSGIGSPPNHGVDPRVLFSDLVDQNESQQPYKIHFRTPNATLPSTPMMGLGLPFSRSFEQLPTYNGYLYPASAAGELPSSGMFEAESEMGVGHSFGNEMEWETYEAPSRALTPPPDHGVVFTGVQRKTMNSLSSATILRFSMPAGFEQGGLLLTEPRKEKPIKKKKVKAVDYDDEVMRPPASPERKRPTGVVVQHLVPAPDGSGTYSVEEFSEAESGSASMDQDSESESEQEHDDVFVPGRGEDAEFGVGMNGQKVKKQKRSDKPRQPRAVKPSLATPRVPKKCDWCEKTQSPEWRKGPTGEKTWVVVGGDRD